mmetsp:Transcript_17075/g.24153  ORF Transcript_17075/g.24153 Transcript_17075/m.24153 type:complete len:228 (+) Transcript_17075:2636-3319(+)
MEFPPFFGADGKGRYATKNSREVPGIKTFCEWNAKDGYTGARYALRRSIEQATNTLRQSAVSNLQGSAANVASEMISSSQTFLITFCEWMTQRYSDLTGRASKSDLGAKDNVWKLISHCIRSIFHDLHECRSTGRGPFTSNLDRAGRIMWECLQAHTRMKAFLRQGFSADITLSHVLNLHLQDNAVIHSKMDEVNKRPEALVIQVNHCISKTCDIVIKSIKVKLTSS